MCFIEFELLRILIYLLCRGENTFIGHNLLLSFHLMYTKSGQIAMRRFLWQGTRLEHVHNPSPVPRSEASSPAGAALSLAAVEDN